MSNYITNLNWRYATKKFDSAKVLTQEQLTMLKESVRLSPSSFGLFPYKVFVVENMDLREKLKEKAFGQSQITDASHLFVFAARNEVTPKDIEHFVELVAKERNTTTESLSSYKEMMAGFVHMLSKEQQATWAEKQAYIGLGFLLSAAAQNNIDACPMEGFDNKAFDQVLGLGQTGYHSAVVCPIGFRSDEDSYAKAPKVRKKSDEVFESK